MEGTMPRDCDDIRLYYCPKCGHRWERRAVHCGRLSHRLGRWGWGIVAVYLALAALCWCKILGWL